MNFVRSLGAASLLLSLTACGSASAVSNDTSAPQQQQASSSSKTAKAEAISTGGFQMGVNVNTTDLWQNSRPFMNLIYGTPAQMQNTAPWGPGQDVPANLLDDNGWVKSVPAGYRVVRGLSVPAAGGDIVCRYQGNGTLTVANGTVSNVSSAAGVLRFTVPASNPADWKAVSVAYNVDPANYIRNIDCREASASTTANIAPEFLSSLSGFKVIRFMKWNRAAEANNPVTWATRNKPGDGDVYGRDGVPVEYIVEAANSADADPWVSIPWNADNDYITKFATYVRDNMAANHKVYVEVSNEVWNWGYPVTTQASNEAKSEGLLSAEGTGTPGGPGERYSEKTKQVMQIWSTVFAGQMNRLVRVFAFQHVQPYWSDKLLAYQNVYQSVDALATAPYFGYDVTASQTLDQAMATLASQATDAVNFGVQQKAVAQKYGLQYLTYEAGQHVVMSSNQTLLTQIERDSRMYDVYTSFISGWQNQVGGLLTMFTLQGPVSSYGAWGMSDYSNQPLTETPKRRAVQAFLGIQTATTAPPPSTTTTSPSPPVVVATTQVCPDGSVISSTSICPTTTTTSPNPGKAKGKSKNGQAIA